jgi:hypothetical protein
MMHYPPNPPLTRESATSFSSLPEPISRRGRNCMERYSASAKRNKFLKRLIKLNHMDFQFAMWQMIYLFFSPQRVFRDFVYRKQTKNQFARDDPAFLVLLSAVLVISSLIFGICMSLSAFNLVKFVIWVVLIDCIIVGILIASVYWYISNKFLLKNANSNLDVEWAYCFDVHLNAFLPLLAVLHVLQLPFLFTIINHDWYISTIIGNTFWLVAISYYFYNLFIGFSVLPFLTNTKVLLYPFTLLIFVYILTIGLNLNLSRMLLFAYEYRLFTWP